MRKSILSALLLVWGAQGTLAHACSTHGLVQAAVLDWAAIGISAGVVQGSLTLGSTLVPPASSTVCTAGIGLGTLDNPLPAGVDVVSLAIVIVHVDGSRTPLSAFSFAPNTITSAALAAGSGSSSVLGTNPLFEGSTWFGFSSAVDPFALPTLGPGEVTAFDFTIKATESLLPLTVIAQFAGGEGQTNGTPIFSGDHPAQYFTAEDPSVRLTAPVPEPSPPLLTTVACICALARRPCQPSRQACP